MPLPETGRMNNLKFDYRKKSISQISGYQLLEANFDSKEVQQKAELLQNRINRLNFEQERAHKVTQMAEKKADKLLEARINHQMKIDEKEKWRKMRQA